MHRCATCNARIVGGYRDGDERFCSLPCLTANPLGMFCQECLDTTNEQAPGNTFTVNLCGTRLAFARQRCPICHSIVQQKSICALMVPVIPLGEYRVLYTANSRYVGRRVVAKNKACA